MSFSQELIDKFAPEAQCIQAMKIWKLPDGKENMFPQVCNSGDYFAELKKEISERFKSKWQDERYVKKVLDSRKKAYEKKEYREKLSKIRIGCKWWNNGFEQKFQKEKPDGDEWVLGRLKKK